MKSMYQNEIQETEFWIDPKPQNENCVCEDGVCSMLTNREIFRKSKGN